MALVAPSPRTQWPMHFSHYDAPTSGCVDELGCAGAGRFSEASTEVGDYDLPSTGNHTPYISVAPCLEDLDYVLNSSGTGASCATRLPQGLRCASPLRNGTAYDRQRFAVAERAAAFTRHGAVESRKIADAVRQKEEIEEYQDRERHRCAEATQMVREERRARVETDSLAKRAVLAMRNGEYIERLQRGSEQVEVDEEWAHHQRCVEASERASVRQQRIEIIAHSKALAKNARPVESADRRRRYEERCALLDAVSESHQARLETTMRLLGKIAC